MSDPFAESEIESLRGALEAVRKRIADACLRAGRRGPEPRIIPATKYGGAALCRALFGLGIEALGENRVARLNSLAERLPEPPPRWHMIGHLQRSNLRQLRAPLAMLHSLDSLKLARLLGQQGGCPAVLIQVNVAGEAQKNGISPAELPGFLDELAKLDLAPRGLMCMAPQGDEAAVRGSFRGLRELRDEQRERGHEGLVELSMGMSGDFEVAVEEGATMVRLGRILYPKLDAALAADKAQLEA